jgi:hypothetical protein
MNAMMSGVQSFLDEVYRVADIHYGLITFNGVVGNSLASGSSPSVAGLDIGSTFNKPTWDLNYTPAGTANYPIPLVELNPNQGTVQSNYSTLTGVLNGTLISNPAQNTYSLCPYGHRGTALAIKTALDQLDPANGRSRSWANKAVIIVTDGSPTNDLSGNVNPPSALTDAIAQAARAGTMGIPVYVVYVNLSPTDPATNLSAYDEKTAGSICATAGHDSKAYAINWSDSTTATHDFVRALGNVARRLAGLLR